jgi:spermidine synthase
MAMKSRSIIPVHLYLLAGCSAIASSVCIDVWFRQFALFFGTHAVSTSTITFSVLGCMGIGCLVTGRLADTVKDKHFAFAVISTILGIFVLSGPVLFSATTALFLLINTKLNPGSLGIGILRFALSFLFFMIPAGLTSAASILLGRQYIRHTAHAGRFMSAFIVSGGTGIAAGLILSALLLVPFFGYRMSNVIAGLIFLFLATATYVLIINWRFKSPATVVPPLIQRVKKAALRFRKKKTVLETVPKLTRALVKVYAFQAFTAAVYLMLSLRLLSYYNAIKPVYFQSLVIAILMAGLALGSTCYRRFTEQKPNHYLTMASLQILTGFVAVLSYLLLYITHQVTFGKSSDSGFIHHLLNHFLLYATLVFLPSFTMGLSLPIVGRVYTKRMQTAGRSFGKLGFIWNCSALSGIILARFILVPLTGLYYAYYILILLIILSGIYLIIKDSRLIRGFRLGYAIFSLLLYISIVVILKSFHFSLPGSGSGQSFRPVKKIEGSTVSLSTVEKSGGDIQVLVNNREYFSTDKAGNKVQQISAWIPMVLNSQIRSAVVIGFGSGLTASLLEDNGISDIHITEIIPEIIRFSSDVLSDLNDDILTSSHINVTIEDARSYLVRMNSKVDLITSGYNQLLSLPNNYTSGFYELCRKRISADGLVCQVLPTYGISEPEFRGLIKACSQVFPEVTLWYITPENMLLVAARNPVGHDLCRLEKNFSLLNDKDEMDSIGIPDVGTLVAHLLLDNGQLRSYVADAQVNLDDKPFVQYSHKTNTYVDKGILKFLAGASVDYSAFFSEGSACNSDVQETIRKIRSIHEALKPRMVLSSGPQ